MRDVCEFIFWLAREHRKKKKRGEKIQNALFIFLFVTIRKSVEYFHFSIISLQKLLSYSSNKSTWASAIENTIYVEGNIMKNIYEKFQLHPLQSFWEEDFLIFFVNLAFLLPWQPIKSAVLTKFIWVVEDYSRNISVKKRKKNQNICSKTDINANFRNHQVGLDLGWALVYHIRWSIVDHSMICLNVMLNSVSKILLSQLIL